MTAEQNTQSQVSVTEESKTAERKPYRFLNPYNFVRYLVRERPSGHLMGNCPPPPHDRYVGLTGRIVCRVEAKTPLFISDTHATQELKDEEREGHKIYRFFEYEGEPALPASSLRGMIRAVFEAATNSCFAVFDGKQRLEYRNTDVARRMKAGIVKSLPQGDKLGEIGLCREAKVAAYLEDPAKNVLDNTWRCGDQVSALIQRSGYVDNVVRLSRNRSDLRPFAGEKVVQGRLKIGGPTIDNKQREALFYNPSTVVSFSAERLGDYNAVLSKQLESKREDFKTQVQSPSLAVGDLVYVELENDNITVRNIAIVKVPRLRYRDDIGQRLRPKRLRHCDVFDSLCPACRTFGWVSDEQNPPQGKKTAYAGRVRFSHGKPVPGTIQKFETPIPLAILSSPKPTTTNFYLVREDGQPDRTGKLNYDNDTARLRGRKVYRHQGRMLNDQEYVRAGRREDDQNRTVSGALKSGAFTFTVDFENLAITELGALLWTLELEGWHHRLGFAKPLGFGSVLIEVEKLEVCEPGERYATLNKHGWRTIEESVWREHCVDLFKTKMKELYGKDLLDLENIKDLRVLLTEPATSLPIHYPRPPHYEGPDGDFTKPNPEGMQFEWFVGNKRRGSPIPLPLTGEKDEGLPLLEKNGNPYPNS